MTATRWTFGTLADGRTVDAVTLCNANGVRATIVAYGATLQSLIMADRDGNFADVVLGHDDLRDYVEDRYYLGASVGRFANRIAGGVFSLDGAMQRVAVNDGGNSLHGGTHGFDKALWEIVPVATDDAASVAMRHISPEGDQGYPGTLTVIATFSLDENDHLTIDYRATTDRPTIVNLTNHAYWNLSGEGSPAGATGHVLTIPAATFLPVDSNAIPTGEFHPVADTPFDFRSPRAIDDRIRDASDAQIMLGRGYDHSWALSPEVVPDQQLMARLTDPASGRGLELWSNQPGLQLYTANFFDATRRGKSGNLYRMGDGIALEPQIFPDSPNRSDFPDARLWPGQSYRNVMTYRLTTGAARR